MKKHLLILITVLVPIFGFAQTSKLNELLKDSRKGDYAILEVRMNNEDEFRTVEGNEGGLARVALFLGNNAGERVLLKEFKGFNSIVQTLNKMASLRWKVIDTYTIRGTSLLITHYVLQRR